MEAQKRRCRHLILSHTYYVAFVGRSIDRWSSMEVEFPQYVEAARPCRQVESSRIQGVSWARFDGWIQIRANRPSQSHLRKYERIQIWTTRTNHIRYNTG